MRPGAWSSARRQVPALGGVRPAMMRSSVLLPQPDGPRTLKNSPRVTWRSTPASASTPVAKRLVTPCSSRIGALLGPLLNTPTRHSREGGNPGQPSRRSPLDPRLRGGDERKADLMEDNQGFIPTFLSTNCSVKAFL